MIGMECVWLMQTPSGLAPAWREAFEAACEARGWAFASQIRGEPTPLAAADRPQLVVSWLDEAGDLAVSHWCVQRGPASESAEVLIAQDNLTEIEGLYAGSHRLATAERLIAGGAVVFDFESETVVVPGLGEVSRSSKPASSKAPALRTALDLYRHAPIRVGDSAEWMPAIFSYPDRVTSGDTPDGLISLIGRRRNLMAGPNIFLPPGVWRFEGQFSLTPPPQTELLIEWGFGYDVQSLTTVFERAGRFSFSFEHVWTDVAPADFRISLMIPALVGQLEFHGGVVTRLADKAS